MNTNEEAGVVDRKPVKHAQNHRMKGFTLAELVVVITIVVIFTGVVTVSVNDINDNTRLSNAADRALADIRYAQEMAMTHRREVDVFVNVGADRYEAKWNDDATYLPCPISGNNLIVTFNQGEYESVSITSSGVGTRLSFTATGAPLIDGSSFGGGTSVMLLNSKIQVTIYPSGYTNLSSGGGAGCGS
jgi:prepilin-type N-terminal cleavage/methylation domain-containing protein